MIGEFVQHMQLKKAGESLFSKKSETKKLRYHSEINQSQNTKQETI